MPVAAGISAAGAIGSGLLGYFGSQNAANTSANTQMQLGQQGLSTLQSMFNTAQTGLQPFMNAGSTALSTLQKLLTPGPNQTAELSQIPGFQFAQDWGQKSVQNLGTSMGLGGNTLTAGANYATGLAQQGFNNIVNPLTSIAGLGTSAASSLAGAATSAGNSALYNLTNMGQNIGNTQASGILGSTNALSGALTGTTGSFANSMLLSKLLGNGAGSGGAGIYGNLGSSGMGLSSGAATGGFYADGGNPPVGQPSVVGEQGPELFVPDQPGTILPANDPRTLAYLRSGALSRAPIANALTAGGNLVAPSITDYLTNGPSALSSMPYPSGKLPSVDPRFTRAVQEGGNLAATAPMLGLAPELGAFAPELAGRAVGMLPRVGERAIADIAGGAAGLPSASTPAFAADRPTINPDEQKQLDAFDAQINGINAKRQQAINKIRRPAGDWDQERYKTAVQMAGSPFDSQISQINAQKSAIQNSVLQRGIAYDQQQAAASAAQQPIAVRNGPALMAARAAAIGTSPLVGGLLGYKGFSPFKQIVGGAVEGALPNIGANTIDYATGGEARRQALQNFTDPNWWKYAVGAESGLAGAGALVGGHVGEAIRTPTPGRPNAPLGAPPAAPPSALAAPPRFQRSDLVQDSVTGRWRVQKGHPSGLGGRFVPPPQ